MFNMKLSWYERLFNVLNLILLTAFALICLYPFYYIFISSISSAGAISRGVFLLPQEVNFYSYVRIFQTPGIGRAAFISLARTVLGTLLPVSCSVFLAYIFTYKEIPFRKVLYRYFIITMYLSAGFVPFFMLISRLGLRDSFLVYIVPGVIAPFFVIIAKTYIESLPESVREAAEIDGAGIMKIFFLITVPLCKPVIACLVVFAAVGQWNSWVDTLWFIQDSDLFTLQYRLYVMLQNNMADAMRAGTAEAARDMMSEVTPASLRLTMTFITTLPILIVYPFMQRYFTKGLMLGAVKG